VLGRLPEPPRLQQLGEFPCGRRRPRTAEHEEQAERHLREAADLELATILNDEPQWAPELEMVLVDFSGAGFRVERA
jgi:hypothetical protein